jgi:hypothetical protein
LWGFRAARAAKWTYFWTFAHFSVEKGGGGLGKCSTLWCAVWDGGSKTGNWVGCLIFGFSYFIDLRCQQAKLGALFSIINLSQKLYEFYFD